MCKRSKLKVCKVLKGIHIAPHCMRSAIFVLTLAHSPSLFVSYALLNSFARFTLNTAEKKYIEHNVRHLRE